MNWIDIVIAIILVINTFNGAQRGLVRTLFGVGGLLLALFICLKGTPFVASILQEMSLSGMAAYLIALVVLFILIYFLINDIGRHFYDLIKESSYKQLDVAGGIVLGFAKGVVYVLFLLIPVLGNIFSSPALLETFEGSKLISLGRPLIYQAEPVIQAVIYQGGEKWQEYSKTLSNLSNGAEDLIKEEAVHQAEKAIISNF